MQQSLYKLKYFSLHNIAWENVIYLHSAYMQNYVKNTQKNMVIFKEKFVVIVVEYQE